MEIPVKGARIYFRITIGSLKIDITQTAISLIAVTAILCIIAAVFGRKLTKRPHGKQVVAEKLVTMLYGMVEDTMGKHNIGFAPYIGTLFLSSIVGSLIGMTQIFRSTTQDLMVTLAWALITTGLVWYHNIKNCGFLGWLKGFTEPIAVMTPMNIISEIAQPFSLAFRHFGNVAGGSVLTSIIYAALSLVSSLVFGWLPGLLGKIPFFAAGIPAMLSLYFDLFSAFVQALVFSLLTMVYIGAANPPAEPAAKSEEA